jgi:hypothetical protein
MSARVRAEQSGMSTPKTLLDLCLLRGQPQDLPASANLLYLGAAFSIGVDYMIETGHAPGLVRLGSAVAQAAIFGGIIYGILRLRGVPERFTQSMSALYFANGVVSLAAWPVLTQVLAAGVDHAQSWHVLFMAGISIWFIAILANVLRHALNFPLGRSVAVSLMCVLLMMFASILVTPLFSTATPG